MFNVQQQQVIWGLVASGWTILVLYLTLSNSDGQTVQAASNVLGGSDLTDALGHGMMFGALAFLWYGFLATGLPHDKALQYASGFSLFAGFATETAQLFLVSREALWLDYVGNALGVVVFVVVWRYIRFSQNEVGHQNHR